jgi:hypothetical protein
MLTHAHCRHPRYEVGLEKLLSAEGQVEGMKAELIALQPELAVAQKETAEALVVIEKSSEEAAAKKLVVEADEVLTPLAYIRCCLHGGYFFLVSLRGAHDLLLFGIVLYGCFRRLRVILSRTHSRA